MKDKNLKLAKVFKYKGPLKGGDANQFKTKVNKNNTPKQKNDNQYAWKKVPPKEVEKDKKTINEKTCHWYKWYKAWPEHDPYGK